MPEGGGRRPVRVGVALGATVAILAAWNLLGRPAVPTHLGIEANLSIAALLLLVGRLGGLTWEAMGLSPSHLGAGARYGGATLVVVSAVLLIGAALPATSHLYIDGRVNVTAAQMAFKVLVAIPIGTVVLEELAFRGVLLGLLTVELSTWWAVSVSAVLFGLWHVQPLLSSHGTAAIVGTVVATSLAGVGFAWLRLRSQSLLAPVLAHIATNSIAFLVAWWIAN